MPPAKNVRIFVTLPRPLHRRLEAQCAERDYSISRLTAKALDAYLTHLEHLPSLDEQLLRQVRAEKEEGG